MSIDRRDFARTATDNQHGKNNNFWPIIVDPYLQSQNGSFDPTGQEFEININPCDHIWLPVCYDASLGINYGQTEQSATDPGGPFNLYYAPTGAMIESVSGHPVTIGLNLVDMIDADSATLQGSSIQNAPVFAFKFNNRNAPWLVWTLGSFPSYWGANNYDAVGGSASNYFVGGGDAMRSISGPITRMWSKLLLKATALTGNQFADNAALGQSSDLRFSRIVLLSTLGFNQQTQGLYSSTENPGASAETSAILTNTSGGGYITPQINTLDKEQLERDFPNAGL